MIENLKTGRAAEKTGGMTEVTGSAAETPCIFENPALTGLSKSAKQPKLRKQTEEAVDLPKQRKDSEDQQKQTAESEGAKVSVLKSAADRVMDLLFPSALYCICCGNLIDETRTYHLCDHCLSHIRWDGSDVRSIRGLKTLSCTRYGLYERSLVFALKYNGRKYIARELAEMMRDRLILAEAEFDVIVPVPMFSEKERRRGFNHAALMGGYLGTLTGKPCFAHGLLRTSDTLPMRGLGPSERRSNVKDKFACNEKYVTMLKGKRVLLLDDFYTTGSTAGECFRALKTAEPKDVLFLAFAARY